MSAMLETRIDSCCWNCVCD